MLDDSICTTVAVAAPITIPLVEMKTLPEAINAAHGAVKEAGKTALLKAKEAGDLLLQAKEQCPHGEFGEWVKKNCTFSYRTAAKYMQVAKSADLGTFDPSVGVDAFLDAHAEPRAKTTIPATDEDEPPTTPNKAPTGPSTKELKTEIARLVGELQAARDALATAEAHIADLMGHGSATTKDVVVSPVFMEEVEALRREVGDLNEMLDEADKTKAELKDEVAELKRQLSKTGAASPKAAQALQSKATTGDEDGYVMQHAADF